MHTFINPDATFIVAQWLFLKLLSFSYLIAFLSLFVQIKGLYGSNGILPMHEIFKGLKRSKNYSHFYYTPSIFWFNRSDMMMQGALIAGIIGSILVLAGVAVPFILLLLYILYLSFVTVGIYFLSFQWDILLLELGFVGFIFSLQTPPLPIVVFLLWVILFRFMFSSGVAKFLAGSQEWRDLSAMEYHYETQPLPNRIAYYFHKQPKFLAQLGTIVTFFCEVVLPFFIFTTSELRFFAFVVFILFQIMLMLTGNFAFFNLLTIGLCCTLVDDRYFLGLASYLPIIAQLPQLGTSFFVSSVSIVLIVLNFLQLADLFRTIPFIEKIMRIISPFCLVNRYGLFSYMTTRRYEIIVEGSQDGETWKAYEFKWKPGELHVPPRQVAPHQPRLDWQMWFAALGQARQNPWFVHFVYRLLEGSKDVVKLLKYNPFPDAPPKFIRANLYEYKFTKKSSENWWQRKYIGVYLPQTTAGDFIL